MSKKLPVIYRHKDGDYVVSDYTDDPKPPSKNFTEYRPVKFCKTCALFNSKAPFDLSPCHRFPLAKHDGTSFCSEHISKDVKLV